ncbi:hypothetical protein [Paenibacillus koleovorans]|uniref:hypothetical protein n=1 Tax=Paenibacillus koleovorans TaxID=121608 RepID=UPI000FDC9C45|nr:hypothetical protein [Paenibacillus koleovorans]
MRELLTAFANDYALRMEDVQDEGDERVSINNPMVFLFLGDKAADALAAVHQLNSRKWLNSAGVVYLHLHSGTTVERDNIYSLKMDAVTNAGLAERPEAHRQFLLNEDKLFELNVLLRRMNIKIAEYGRMYPTLQRLQISVVTMLDDPVNILAPELTVLCQSIFSKTFRLVQADLYALTEDAGDEDGFGHSSSLSIAFLQELDRLQRRDYTMHADLEVTKEHIKLPCKHGPAPLFELVYILGDRDERGIVSKQGAAANHELVCHLNLLKNQDSLREVNPEHNPYNNQQFKQNLIVRDDGTGNCFVSAGYAQVRRPNQAIALTVLSQFNGHLLERLQENSQVPSRDIMEMLGLDLSQMERRVRALFPEREQLIRDMYGIMHEPVSYQQLKKAPMQQAEEDLYGTAAKDFFDHVINQSCEGFEEWELEDQIRSRAQDQILKHPLYGSYSLFEWTRGDYKQGPIPTLLEWTKQVSGQIERIKAELGLLTQERVDLEHSQRFSLLNWFNKKSIIKAYTHQLLNKTYSLKYELAVQELLHTLLRTYSDTLEKLRQQAEVHVKQLNGLQRILHELGRISRSETNDYLGRNINEYYEKVVRTVVEEWEKRKGKQCLFDERVFGTITHLLEQGEELFVRRLLEVANIEVFTHRLFQASFEQELLERANTTISYESEGAVTKQELFRDLFDTLEKEAAIRLDVYRSSNSNRYEEKYFIGDSRSDFLQYAFRADQAGRSCKIGVVSERKRSGVEKLNLMGGFRLQDTMFYRNAKPYYDQYLANGYQFHQDAFTEKIDLSLIREGEAG